MNHESELKLQAYLDGELSATETREVADLLTQDPAAQKLVTELKQALTLLRHNELERKLPAAKDFFWSQIEREIGRSEAAATAPVQRPISPWWWKLLLPVGAAAMLVFLLAPLRHHSLAGASLASLGGIEIESAVPDSSVITFHSDAEGVSFVWVDSQ